VLVGMIDAHAANLNFIAFWRYSPDPENLTGVMFVIFPSPSRPRAAVVSRSSSRFTGNTNRQRDQMGFVEG